MRVVRCKLVVHPTQVQHRIDLPDHVISRNHLVEIKCVEKPALSIPLAPHHALPPSMAEPFERNHDSHPVSIGVLQHIRGQTGRYWLTSRLPVLTLTGLQGWDAERHTQKLGVQARRKHGNADCALGCKDLEAFVSRSPGALPVKWGRPT